MSIEYSDKSKIEQQKLEQKESDKPKTGNDALDFLKQQKMEDKKEAKEGRETPELRQESFSGKQALDIVAQERQALKGSKGEGVRLTPGGMDDGDKGGKGENAQEIDLSKEKIKMSEDQKSQEQQKLAEEKSKLTEQERQKQIDDLLRKGF
ncbi:MAG TPA: hypothetical protein V6C58_07495 [Allocoleopsis sp.]